jgi:hypothetical protein
VTSAAPGHTHGAAFAFVGCTGHYPVHRYVNASLSAAESDCLSLSFLSVKNEQ